MWDKQLSNCNGFVTKIILQKWQISVDLPSKGAIIYTLRQRTGAKQMAYTSKNFKTKKGLKEAIAKGEKVTVYSPGIFKFIPNNGTVTLEGPHFPSPHSWYATATLQDGYIVKVK